MDITGLGAPTIEKCLVNIFYLSYKYWKYKMLQKKNFEKNIYI